MSKKVDFVTVHLDNTHSVKRCLVKGDAVQVRPGKKNHWTPKLKAGKSVFPERKEKGFLNMFKRSRRLVWAVDGCPNCFELNEDAGKLDDYWNTEEGKKFVAKQIALSTSTIKPFTNWQVALISGLLIAVLILLGLVVRRIGI